jgi:hypothetical protein
LGLAAVLPGFGGLLLLTGAILLRPLSRSLLLLAGAGLAALLLVSRRLLLLVGAALLALVGGLLLAPLFAFLLGFEGHAGIAGLLDFDRRLLRDHHGNLGLGVHVGHARLDSLVRDLRLAFTFDDLDVWLPLRRIDVAADLLSAATLVLGLLLIAARLLVRGEVEVKVGVGLADRDRGLTLRHLDLRVRLVDRHVRVGPQHVEVRRRDLDADDHFGDLHRDLRLRLLELYLSRLLANVDLGLLLGDAHVRGRHVHVHAGLRHRDCRLTFDLGLFRQVHLLARRLALPRPVLAR